MRESIRRDGALYSTCPIIDKEERQIRVHFIWTDQVDIKTSYLVSQEKRQHGRLLHESLCVSLCLSVCLCIWPHRWIRSGVAEEAERIQDDFQVETSQPTYTISLYYKR